MCLERSLVLLAMLVAVPAATAAAPAERIGSTVSVVNLVFAQLARDTRTLQVGDAVHQNEIIEAGIDASTEMKLNDETKLALGPGARLTLDRFVYDPNKTTGSIALNLLKGTFRFITGVASKPSYVIRVPTASITVRGTIFDVYVQEAGESWLLLQEGGVQVCNRRGKCRLHDKPGEIIRIEADGTLGKPTRWARMPNPGAVPLDTAFPFLANPPSIDPEPMFTRQAILDLPWATPPSPPHQAETGNTQNGDTTATDPPRRRTVTIEPPVRRRIHRRETSSNRRRIVDGMLTTTPAIIAAIRARRHHRDHDDDHHSTGFSGLHVTQSLTFGHRQRRPPNLYWFQNGK